MVIHGGASRREWYFFNHLSVFRMIFLEMPLVHSQVGYKVLQNVCFTGVAFVFITIDVLFHRSQKILVNLLLEPILSTNDTFAHGISSTLFVINLLCLEINI